MADTKAKLGIDLEVQTAKASRNVKKFQKSSRSGFKAMEDSAKKFSLAFKGAIALFAGQKIISGFNAVIDAAKKQEDAVNALNTQLRLAGDYSEETSKSMQQFASDLQAVSTQGDETTLELLALAKTFDTTNNGAKALTLASTELAAATGQDVNAVMKQLGKTLGGTTGRIAETIPAVKELTAEQLKAGAAIDLVIERFGGSATSKLQTFSGVTTALSNSWGDLQENLGESITKSPALINSLGGITGAIQKIGDFLKTNKIDIGAIFAAGLNASVKLAVKSAQVISRAFRTIGFNLLQVGKLVVAVSKWFMSFDTVNEIVGTGISALAEVVGRLAQGLNLVIKGWAELGRALGLDVALYDDLTSSIDSFSQSLIDAEGEELGKSISSGLETAENSIVGFQESLVSTDEKIQKLGDSISEAMSKGSASINKTSKDLAKGLDGAQTKVQEEKEGKGFADTAADNLKKNFDGSALGKNLASQFEAATKKGGEEAGAEFGKQAVTTIGKDLAETAFPGIGGAIFGALANFSMMSDEEIEKFAEGFVQGAIKFAVILAERAVPISIAIIKGLIAGIGPLVIAIGQGIGKWLLDAGQKLGSFIQDAFKSLYIELPKRLFSAFVDGAQAVYDAIADALSIDLGLGGGGGFGLGGDKGLLGGSIIPGFLNKGGIVGLNQGGILEANNGMLVPGAGNSDSQLAMLTPGEVVIPKPAVNNFANVVGEIAKQAVNGVSNAGEQVIQVVLQINDETLAEQILRLNNDNLRLA